MEKDIKLCQIIAIESGVKKRVYSNFSDLHKLSSNNSLFNGFIKSYTPKDEDGDKYPNENKKVQSLVKKNIEDLKKILAELLDVTATKDYGNCIAKADVVIDGEVLIKDAPTPYLLFLEKQLNDIKTYVEKLPVLDSDEIWVFDNNSNLYKTQPITTNKTKKTQKPIVLYEATDRHPAQTQMINEDVIVGYWETTKLSGAISETERSYILNRIYRLSDAIKQAREKANSIEVNRIELGKEILNYIFN